MAQSTVTSKGQITVPKIIRDHLKLNSGDPVEFRIQSDGTVIMIPASISISQLKGILHRKGMKPVSVERMSRAIRKQFENLK
jgi:AbrB family looped-hinge helix DNA binding protein